MKELIRKISEGTHLTRAEASSAMTLIMEGQTSDAQIAAFLIALKMKGERIDELLGFVDVMRDKSLKIRIADPEAIDMCGTGGDAAGTFNISTVASFVVAGAGVTVAKHGNRSISSACGSADVLAALGVNIEVFFDSIAECINRCGIGFLFAPHFHPAMKYAAAARSQLGIKTCFNMLGPLTNPAGVRRQLVGTFSRESAAMIASLFAELKAAKVFVVHSHDGLDEISLENKTTVHAVTANSLAAAYEVDASTFGMSRVTTSAIRGGNPAQNAGITMQILNGEHIPHRSYVIANSAFGLMAAEKVTSVEEGVSVATEALDSGKALKKLQALISHSRR